MHDAWRVTRLNQGHQAPRGTFGENSPHIYKEHPEGKNGEKIFAVTIVTEGQYMSKTLRPESEGNLRIADQKVAEICGNPLERTGTIKP